MRLLRSFALVALVTVSLNAPSRASAGVIASNPSSPNSAVATDSGDANIWVTLSQSPLPNVITYVDLFGPSSQSPTISFNVSGSNVPAETVSGIESSLGSFSSYRCNLPSALTAFATSGAYVFELRNIAGGSFYASAPNVSFTSSDPSVVIGYTNQFGSGIYQGSPYQISLGAAAVPEPSTYVLAVTGLACGGYSLFRRRRAR